MSNIKFILPIQGQWRNDFYNGDGTMIHTSGMTYDGLWINGNPASKFVKPMMLSKMW